MAASCIGRFVSASQESRREPRSFVSTPQEFRIYFTDSAGAERSLDQMGTGKQQMFWMLGRLHMNPSAVVMLEEPEAHLPKDMILPLASYFLKAIEPRRDNGAERRPMIDQLWLETHHHAFAIQPYYLDVSLQDGWTRVERKPRSRAAEHFYEPGPFFSALRQLVGSIVDFLALARSLFVLPSPPKTGSLEEA